MGIITGMMLSLVEMAGGLFARRTRRVEQSRVLPLSERYPDLYRRMDRGKELF